MIHVFIFCDICSWVPCYFLSSSTASSSEKSSSSRTFFGFPASSAYLIPFQKELYDFEIHIFTQRITEGLIHSYYKRWKHLLMLENATQCFKRRGMQTFEQDDDDDDV